MEIPSTLTIRTDAEVKRQAAAIFNSFGMNISTAVNIFLRQTIRQKRYPCIIDSTELDNTEETYPAGFFDFFGSNPDTEMKEYADLPPEEVQTL